MNNTIRKINNLYYSNILEYSYYPINSYNTSNVFIDDDFLQVIINNEFMQFNFEKNYKKIDLSIGYKKILVCERIYNKCFSNKYIKFDYEVKTKYKAIKRGNGSNIYEFSSLTDYKELCEDYLLKTIIFEEFDDSIDYDEITTWYELTMKEITVIHSYKRLKDKLDEIDITNHKPKLLLHSCCGPCSSYVLEFLHNYFDITILFFNPNIYPKEEYEKRFDVQKELIDKMGLDINIISKDYNHNYYLDRIKGFEDYPEKSKRCYICYYLRLEETAKLARNSYDYFSTTISISPHKVSSWINEIGIEFEKKYNVKYLYSDFKQENGYLESINLSKKYKIYRQEYCGCEFSIKK